MKHTRRRSLLAAALALTPAARLRAQPAPIELHLGSGYGPDFLFVRQILDRFIPESRRLVAATGTHSLEWKLSIAGAVARPPETLQAVRDGRIDVGHVPTILNEAQLPLQSIAAHAPFGPRDARTAAAVIRHLMTVEPAYAAAWAAAGQVPLTNFALDSFVLFSVRPLRELGSLRGLRVGGSGSNLRWLGGLGVTGVPATAATVGQDLRAGRYDAVLTSVTVAAGARLHEVAPHLLDPGFGALNTSAITVNAARWRAMAEPVRQALQQAADDFWDSYHSVLEQSVALQLRRMQSEGLAVTLLPEAQRLAWARGLPPLAREWTTALEERGVPARAVLAKYIGWLAARGEAPMRDWSAD